MNNTIIDFYIIATLSRNIAEPNPSNFYLGIDPNTLTVYSFRIIKGKSCEITLNGSLRSLEKLTTYYHQILLNQKDCDPETFIKYFATCNQFVLDSIKRYNFKYNNPETQAKLEMTLSLL